MVDGHYLCTTAACGHESLVRPVRMGVRRGQPIVVNRQLCVARRIRSPWASDIVYVLMKPLEWLFLAVIYLNDARPEDRISMQYISPVPENFRSQQISAS